ncbi:hypothetical protein [Ruicaihuangia caeni]|uniref:hypothetical protein n=1 Tax=Ruicaihuangia caeni TaxID=3042517 RepID=UPI00338E6656
MARNNGLIIGPPARADLMPPEVGQRAKARTTRGLMMLAVVAAVGVVVAGYLVAMRYSDITRGALEQAQNRTIELLGEQAKYSEASILETQIDQLQTAREFGMRTEVLWAEVLAPARKQLPPGARLVALDLLTDVPWAAPMGPSGPLRQPRVASVAFQVATPDLPTMTDWSRAVGEMKGVADVTIDASVWEKERNAYVTVITMNVDGEWLAERFAADEEEDDQ